MYYMQAVQLMACLGLHHMQLLWKQGAACVKEEHAFVTWCDAAKIGPHACHMLW